MPSGFRWITPPDQVLPELAKAQASYLHQGVKLIAQRWAPEITNWLKENAPWTDRTSNARQSLHTDVEEVVNRLVTLWLAHGMDYGIYLELDHGGRFAVVGPALDHFAPKIWADVERMVKA